MGKRLVEAKKCSICGKILRHWNKSGLCSYHCAEAHRAIPEIKKKNKETQKRYYKKNKERIQLNQKEWYLRRKERILKQDQSLIKNKTKGDDSNDEKS